MSLIDNLKWRYATKKFDTSKKVSEKDIEFLKDAVNLSASSYGLQPYKVLLIKDEKIREKLREASWGQPQITDSIVIFLFCNYNDVDEKVIDNYIALKSDIQNIPIEQLSSSDSNLFRHHTFTNILPSSSTKHNLTIVDKENEIGEEKIVLLHLTPQYQTNLLTNLSIYYVSSFETIEMIAIALLGKTILA